MFGRLGGNTICLAAVMLRHDSRSEITPGSGGVCSVCSVYGMAIVKLTVERKKGVYMLLVQCNLAAKEKELHRLSVSKTPQLSLQIETLRLVLRLGLHHPLPGRPEIIHFHAHTPLSESHEAGF